jgi:hypothetical protein
MDSRVQHSRASAWFTWVHFQFGHQGLKCIFRYGVGGGGTGSVSQDQGVREPRTVSWL